MLSGRGRELADLGRALADGRPVLVIGEPGIGKTALLRAAAEATGRPFLEGGALATLPWLSYLPFSRAVGHELSGADTQAVAFEVQEAVGEGLLVLDDLQWAAPATWEVVGWLAGRVPLALGARSEGAAAVPAPLTDAGLLTLALGPLDAAEAEALARRVRPGIIDRDVEQLLRRAGGSPLLLRELASSPEASPTLRRSVGARLRALAPPDRTAFALLALAGRPLPTEVLGEASAAALGHAGLVLQDEDGRVDVRHALLGEVAVEELEPDTRRSLHARLGELLADPGEAARHLDQAGDREGSRRKALLAAETARLPGERASHLRLAAVNSDDEGADQLRLAAAESLEAAHDWDGVFAVLDQVTGTDPETVARAALVRARSAWSGARLDELEPALETGLAAVGGTGTALETLLRIETCRVPIFLEADPPRGVALGREVLAVASATGVGEARAAYFLGTALAIMDDPEGPRLLEQAVADARVAGEVGTELTAANNLVSFHESSGSPATAVGLAREMARRSHELGLGFWESDFTYQALQLDFHAGKYDGLLAEIADLAARPLDPRSRDALTEVECLTLVDIGRPDEATSLAEVAMAKAAADSGGAVHFWWALAEAALASGRPQRALECAEAYLAGLPETNPNDAFGWVTRAWAQLELGLEPATGMAPTDRPMLFAVPHELTAVGAAHVGRYDDAADELAEAATLWAPYHRRGELRCAWAAGEMLRRGGRADEAVEALTRVESRARDVGCVAILHRSRRSLRAAGHRRASARSSGPVGLTGREQEVLALVARGLTNEQIATRLGVTRRTVVTQIASAMTKLGAENRLQAAVLAARVEDGDAG